MQKNKISLLSRLSIVTYKHQRQVFYKQRVMPHRCRAKSRRGTLLRNISVHKFRIQTIVIAAQAHDYDVRVLYSLCIMALAVRPCNVTRGNCGTTGIVCMRQSAAFETIASLSYITKEYCDLAKETVVTVAKYYCEFGRLNDEFYGQIADIT
jgi:hypothetical protein